MTTDVNIQNDATEPESYRLGLDAALKEAIQAFIDVRFVPEDEFELEDAIFGAGGAPEGAFENAVFGVAAAPQVLEQAAEEPFLSDDAAELCAMPQSYGAPSEAARQAMREQAPTFARNLLAKSAPPAAPSKEKTRGGALSSIGKAIGGLAHRGKHAKASTEELIEESAEQIAEELAEESSCFEEIMVLEEPTAAAGAYVYDAAIPAQETSVFRKAGRHDAERTFGSGAYGASLKQWLDEVDAPFSTTLLRLIDERGYDDVDVYKRAGMSRQLFSRIRSDAEYRPAKKTVLALAVALRLNADEARDLLERAGFALSRSDKRDLVVEYFLENGMHDLMAVNQALYDFDQPLL